MNLEKQYQKNKHAIKQRLSEFKRLNETEQFKEFMFCMLTPQSNAQRCWQAVERIAQLKRKTPQAINEILKTKTRFHNNKTRYILQAENQWTTVKPLIDDPNKKEARNKIASLVNGYGLKEASHFLRNIGKSENQVAILDRHILRNLKKYNVIDDTKIKNPRHYKEIEKKFIKFSNQVGIPVDELDLLFWSSQNGEIFK